MANLIVLTGVRKGVVVTIGEAAVVGRTSKATLQLPDFLVSTEHARVVQRDDEFLLTDLGSTNGTYRNGVRVQGAVSLTAGDLLHFGSTDVVFTDRERLDASLLTQISPALLGLESPAPTSDTEPASEKGTDRTVVLSKIHAMERGFSEAGDIETLLERIALHFSLASGGTQVILALRTENGLEVVKELEFTGAGITSGAGTRFDPELLGRACASASPLIEPGRDGKWSLYAPLNTYNRAVGGVVVHGLPELPNESRLTQLAIGGSLGAVYCRNHLLLDELRTQNAELEKARSLLARWNEELEETVTRRTIELRRSEERHRELFEGALEGNFTVGRDGRVQALNRTAVATLAGDDERGVDSVLGLRLGEVLGKEGAEALFVDVPLLAEPPASNEDAEIGDPRGEAFAAWLDRLAAEPPRGVVSFARTDSRGEVTQVELLVRPTRHGEEVVGLHGVLRDVTRRYRAEQRMRLLTRVVDSTPDAVVTTDLEGEVTSWNPGAEKLYGHQRADVLGELTPVIPDERVDEYGRLLEATAEGRTLSLRSARVDAADREFPVQLTLAPVPGPDGGIEGMVEIARDIGAELQQEELVRWRERMATFADVAAGLGHELGNPLTNLLSGVDLLLSSSDRADGESREVLSVLRGEIQRLRRLVRETLGLALWKAPELSTVDLAQLVPFVATSLRARCQEQGVELNLEAGASPLIVDADEDQLKQALLNLSSNALVAMPQGGSLTLSWELNGSEALLAVADTGVGIPDELLGRIFELYYTRSREGSGIGLAIVKRIVDMHRGRLEVESEQDVGTRFTIALRTRAQPEGQS